MAWRAIFFFLWTSSFAAGTRVALVTSSLAGYVLSSLLFLFTALCAHIWSLRPAANLSLAGLYQAYKKQMLCRIAGRVRLWIFNYKCRNVENTQKNTLLNILNTGKNTVYCKENNMAGIKNVEDFRSRVQLTDYNNYIPYVDRCLEGEKNVLFEENIDFFAATSGTSSGKSKLYPVNCKKTVQLRMDAELISYATTFAAIPKLTEIRFQQNFGVPSRTLDAGEGFKKGSVSSLYLAYNPLSCTPREGYTVHDEHTGQYIHMVFALREREVGMIMAMTSSVLFMILSLVEHNWQKLVLDIRTGRLDSGLDIPDDVRAALNKQLTPDPTRADELEAIFRSGFKEMVPRIWPDLGGIIALCTGTFALQCRLVQERYVGYDVAIFCNVHISTEGIYDVLLFDDGFYKEGTREVRDDFIILCDLNFYECIPMLDVEKQTPNTILAQEVETDAIYELVVTTPRGLYRYRTGDVVRVVGFRGTTPKYQIMQRVGDVLNLHVEKVPEAVFREAIEEASNGWTSGKLVHFAGCENVHVDKVTGEISDNLYYTTFIEMDASRPLSREESDYLDEALCRRSDTYRAFRRRGIISPLKIIQIHPGTFDQLKNMAASTNPLLYRLQYKHPRVVRSEARLRVLLKNQI